MAGLTVVYDACVLYPASLRDFLIELASTRLFHAKWTNEIQREWVRAALRRQPELSADALARTKNLMNAAVADSLVEGYEHLIGTVALPDPDDRHVVAAAIHARADAIITYNLSDFPAAELSKNDLQAIHPDAFISGLFERSSTDVLLSARRHRVRLRHPPKSPDEYLDTLRRVSLASTVTALSTYRHVI